MILIDKEKFIEEVRKRKYSAASIKLIEEQPEIDAIPVAWIMWDWRKKQPNDTQEDECMRLGILKMLRDWEKENE